MQFYIDDYGIYASRNVSKFENWLRSLQIKYEITENTRYSKIEIENMSSKYISRKELVNTIRRILRPHNMILINNTTWVCTAQVTEKEWAQLEEEREKP
jgi:hypothetical protein